MSHIVIIGAGNVATHISRHLHSLGYRISCIYSRTSESVDALAGELGIHGTNIPEDVPVSADFYIVCVPDHSIEAVVRQFQDRKGIWVHTSGALSMEVFDGKQQMFGVLYPLQTLSKKRPVSLGEAHFLVEGSSPAITETIKSLASGISENIHEIDSQTRLVIHAAAVFANNFSNHMVHIAQEILREQKLDEKLLNPLLEETYNKIVQMGAKGAQTGPALRGDKLTMKKHLELLRGHPEWEKMYTFISREIDRSRND